MSYSLVVEPKIKNKKVLDKVSSYNPDDRTKARLLELKTEFQKAQEVRTRNYREFNYRSISQYADDCQDRFINFINDDTNGDPAQQWKANTVRPLTRNKVMEIAAYVTTRTMYPRVEAQNEKSEPDQVAATVMEDLMRWTNEQSDYDMQFLYSVISMLVYPVTYIHEGYAEYYRDFKELKEDGSYVTKKKKDEVFSGFISSVVPWDEIYIGNPYENNIQKQPFLIHRKIIDYSAAKIKYGDNKDFKEYVKPGVRVYLDESNSLYEQEDESINADGVEEITYYNRIADLELTLVNGVMMCDPDKPIQRADKRYSFAKSGYGLFDGGKFAYYKSLVDDLKPDQDQADQLINLILDGTYLKMIPPSALYGDEAIETNIMIPGTVHPLGANSRLEPLQVAGDIGLGMNTLSLIESNAADSSKKDITQSRQQTAYEISRVEEDIKTKLGLFGRMIADMVLQYGNLRISTIIEHLTVAEVGQLTDSSNAVSYAKILLSDSKSGRENTVIEFTDEIPEEGMTQDAILAESYKLLAREGNKLDNKDKRIIRVQPKVFRELKYTTKISPNTIFKTSDAAERAFALELHDRLLQEPMADQNARFKLLIDAYRPGEIERFKAKEQVMPQPAGPVGPVRGGNALLEKLQGGEVQPPKTPQPAL